MSGGMIRKEQVRNSARMYAASPVSQSYDVQWTAASANPTLADGTLAGRYVLRGNMCLVMVSLIFGASTTGGTGNWSFSLPFTADSNGVTYFGVAQIRDAGTNNYPRIAQVSAGGTAITTFIQLDNATNVNNISATAPFTFGNGDSVAIQIEYEIA